MMSSNWILVGSIRSSQEHSAIVFLEDIQHLQQVTEFSPSVLHDKFVSSLDRSMCCEEVINELHRWHFGTLDITVHHFAKLILDH